MKTVVQKDVRWRGSVTDLATDCAELLTAEQGLELARELVRFLSSPGLMAQKYLSRGFKEEK